MFYTNKDKTINYVQDELDNATERDMVYKTS